MAEGVGLSNTRRRLKHLYGDSHKFDLKKLDNGGLGVSLEVPFRESKSVSPAPSAIGKESVLPVS